MNRELTQAYIQKSKMTPTNWFLNCLETTYAYFITSPSGASEVEEEEVKYFIRVYAWTQGTFLIIIYPGIILLDLII